MVKYITTDLRPLTPISSDSISEKHDVYESPAKMGSYILDQDGHINLDRQAMENHYGFRLQELHRNSELLSNKDKTDDATSVSAYSNYKNKIDAMFDDSKSCNSECSQNKNRNLRSLLDGKYSSVHKSSSSTCSSNNIQEKIEKMFEDISISNGFTRSDSFKNLSSPIYEKRKEDNVIDTYQNSKFNEENKVNLQTVSRFFSVKYLGAFSLPDKVVSLPALQIPLSQLYVKYKRSHELPDFRNQLEISKMGLKIRQNNGTQLNQFQAIAVWAAVKFTCRRNPETQCFEHAFLPLIADPDGIDKNSLFRRFMQEDEVLFEAEIEDEDLHLPLFTVVMRRSLQSKILDCHAFICKSSEEAIVIAANLYQALLKSMKKKKEKQTEIEKTDDSDATLTEKEMDRPSEKYSEEEEEEDEIPKKKTPPPVPMRPDKKTIISNSRPENEELIMELEQIFKEVRQEPVSLPKEVKKPQEIRDIKKDIEFKIKNDNEFKMKNDIEFKIKNDNEFKMKNDKEFKIKNDNEFKMKNDMEFKMNDNEFKMKNDMEFKIKKEPLTRTDNIKLTPTPLPEPKSETKPVSNRVQRRGSEPCNIFFPILEPEKQTTLRRSASERRNGITINESENGDILTKVAIPRSRSFLNANGPLTRYPRRDKTNQNSDDASPLGFNELFNEFRIHEGLESMDDILNAIIDAEGMSFNELKPIYKEFLLKLAVTLTKDELYQRSKNIMRRQRKRKSENEAGKKKKCITVTNIRKVFRKTASKLKAKSTRPATLEFTSIVFQSSNTKHFDTTSTSSFGKTRKGTRLQRRQSNRKRYTHMKRNTESKKMSTTSDDSDFFVQKKIMNHIKASDGGCPNRSSSGYFSCSECSFDSENCRCNGADKCYCSIGHKNKKRMPSKRINSENEKSASSIQLSVDVISDKNSVSSCGCDTDSCIYSEKCYCNGKEGHENVKNHTGLCQTPHLHQNAMHHNKNCPNFKAQNRTHSCQKHPTIFDQLKEQGFAASESSLSRAASPSTAWQLNENIIKKECVKPSRSLEFMRPNHKPRQGPPEPPPIRGSMKRGCVDGTRHFCYHGSSDASRESTRYRRDSSAYSSQRRMLTRRQFHSMRSRNFDYNTPRSKKSYSSMRVPAGVENALEKVLFPNASRNNTLRYTRRMDVYNSFTRLSRSYSNPVLDIIPVENTPCTVHPNNMSMCRHSTRTSQAPCVPSRRSSHTGVYPATVHHRQERVSKATEYEVSDSSDVGERERKVLVVSARDPKGKVLYMGASSRGEKGHKKSTFSNRSKFIESDSSNACEALSVKKSAEIAALFSDVCKNKSLRGQSKENLFYSKEYKKPSRPYRTSNMENSLGYLP